MSRGNRRVMLCAGAALAVAALPAALLACGPFFPNQLLVMGDRALLTAPAACFQDEMRRMKLPAAARFKAVVPEKANPWRQTIEADLAELGRALTSSKVAEKRRAQILAGYRTLAEALRYEARQSETPWDQQPPERPDFKVLEVPAGLPGEFEDYIRGALLWRQGGRGAEPRATWEKLLARPAGEQRNRSVWAAFMIGRSLLDEEGAGWEKAIPWFEKTRALAAEGFADSLGLAAASWGWQARAELHRKRHGEAIRLYLEQLAAGDGTAVQSLQTAAGSVLDSGPEALKAAAADSAARAVVTAYLVSRGGPFHRVDEKQARAWLAAVEGAGKEAFTGADRLAAAAYQLGDMDGAGRWLERAPDDSPSANWLRAKLLMRAGKLDAAAGLLARASRGFPQDERWEDRLGGLTAGEEPSGCFSARELVRGELGVLQLARRHYSEALDCLARGGYSLDAGYVAERVLTLDELTGYVDANWPEPRQQAALPERCEFRHGGGGGLWLRWLLARRLVRAGRFDAARPYLPAELRPRLDELSGALGEGRDPKKPQAARAEALWRAARIMRRHGLDLLGTECEPDWAWAGGSYELEPATRLRAGQDGRWQRLREEMAAARINVGSRDELARLALNKVAPEERYHYRYRAANLAWEAAGMMPDDSDATARVLCEAGGWLQNRDPQAADRFYKALVRRCGRTELGREADRLRWFPKVLEPK
ncbi:MAG TPA: hypothetical protein PK280_10500 [Planctomycetota bacterium]|nr:hypothetical protein [Planctomycetota bacterium]